MLLIGLSLVTCLQASIDRGTVQGIVTDHAVAVLVGVRVVVKNVATNLQVSLVTNSSGFYLAPELVPGRYAIHVEAPGFVPVDVSGVTVTAGVTAQQDLSLKVTSVSQRIEVTAAPSLVEASPSNYTTSLQSHYIQDILLYSQQPAAGPVVCSDVLSDEPCNVALLRRDASRSVPHRGNGAVEYGSLTHFRYRGSDSEPEGLVSGSQWTPPFPSRQEGSPDCCGWYLRSDRTGAWSLSATNDNRFRRPGLDPLSLPAWNQQNSSAGQQDEKSSATQGSPKHIFLVVPAFHVAYQKTFQPLTRREKFDEWAHGIYDPRGLGFYVFEAATLEYSSKDGFCGYGKGGSGYGKCFGALELDASTSSFLGDFLFPVILHQDPRYFRLGQGSLGKRMGYAISRVFVTHADSGRTVFFTSALSGSVLGAAASNLYSPVQDRGFGHTLNRIGKDLGNTALFNVAAEFWPDIKHRLRHAFGRQ